MKAKPLTVHWHQDDQPIYSADFQPNTPVTKGLSPRLATAGGDNNVRLWQLNMESLENATDTSVASVVYIATLEKHTQAVNVVKFDPSGRFLASAGDDGVICIWTLASSEPRKAFGEEELVDLESWRVLTTCRGTGAEIYDLAWSPDSKYVAAAVMDNTTRIYAAETGKCVKQLAEHGHYVQGVAWDPNNEYLATQSSDRTMIVYKVTTKNGALIVGSPQRTTKRELDDGRLAVYHNETFTSFFRRLAFAPDGSLLVSPAGQLRNPQQPDSDVFYIFTRAGLGKGPAALVAGDKPSLAVAFSPVPRKLEGSSAIGLPYRLIYAVALYDSVMIYDTSSAAPLAQVRNIHYSSLTDLAWTPDGNTLFVTSTDGFCSALLFESGELGDVYDSPLLNTKSMEPRVTPSPIKQASLDAFAKPGTPEKVQTKIPAPVFSPVTPDVKVKKRVAPTLISSTPPGGP